MYKSVEGHRQILNWVDAHIRDAHLQSQSVYTSYGYTHILEAGDPALPALILLPGTNFSAFAWQHYIAPLSESFHVIAVDIIGQPGKSSSVRRPFKGFAYAEWLVSLLDALRIERAHFMGHSLGGWVALKLAVYAPERVAKLVLVDPAGIVPLSISPRMIWKSMNFMMMPNARSSRGLLDMMSVHPADESSVEWMTLVGRYVQSSLAPPPLPEHELRNIKADILLLSGEQDVFLPPRKLLPRARQLLSSLRVVTIHNAGHLVPEEQPQQVMEQIEGFLTHTI